MSRVGIYVHGDGGKLDEILRLLRESAARERIMAGELNALRTEVAALRTVNDSVLALIDGLKVKLDEAIASGNMEEVKTLTAELATERSRLAAAVVQNTPQA